jgi:hypothetical protein
MGIKIISFAFLSTGPSLGDSDGDSDGEKYNEGE